MVVISKFYRVAVISLTLTKAHDQRVKVALFPRASESQSSLFKQLYATFGLNINQPSKLLQHQFQLALVDLYTVSSFLIQVVIINNRSVGTKQSWLILVCSSSPFVSNLHHYVMQSSVVYCSLLLQL